MNKRNCLYFSAKEFAELMEKWFNAEVEFSLDGIWVGTKTDEISMEEIYEKIEENFDVVKVTSIHMDDSEDIGVWAVYEESKSFAKEKIIRNINDNRIVVFYSKNSADIINITNLTSDTFSFAKFDIFDSYAEFVSYWYKMVEAPTYPYYTVFFDGRNVCSGKIDHDDIDMFEANDYFDNEKMSLKEFYSKISKNFTEKFFLKSVLDYAQDHFDNDRDLHEYLMSIFGSMMSVSVTDIYRTEL